VQTRARIVAAAERHFAERGFEAARLEDIAADVGIRRAAIFYHFGDKQELYDAVLDAAFAGALSGMSNDGTLAERLETWLANWIDYVAQRPSVARLILREAANAQPSVKSPLERAGQAPIAWFRAVIDEGIAKGELKPVADPYRFISLMGATTVFHFAAMPWLVRGVPFDAWNPVELEKHKRELLVVARIMLGIASPPRSERG
jgi:TetR/AcrR family transcriptional regulator